MTSWRSLVTCAATIAATLVATLLVFNLSLGNKEVDRTLESRYTVADPQFERVMGVVLTPNLVAGNRVRELVNGEQIFPAMLGAIRSASHSRCGSRAAQLATLTCPASAVWAPAAICASAAARISRLKTLPDGVRASGWAERTM
jgi:hypothetical protein